MSLVLDNSVTMRWFFEDGSEDDLTYAEDVLISIMDSSAIVPVTWALEVAHVLTRAEAKSLIKPEQTTAFIRMLKGLEIKTDETTHEFALSDTLGIARKYTLSAYDASYLELALRQDSPLATLDLGLRKAAKKSGVKIFS